MQELQSDCGYQSVLYVPTLQLGQTEPPSLVVHTAGYARCSLAWIMWYVGLVFKTPSERGSITH